MKCDNIPSARRDLPRLHVIGQRDAGGSGSTHLAADREPRAQGVRALSRILAFCPQRQIPRSDRGGDFAAESEPREQPAAETAGKEEEDLWRLGGWK